MVLARNIALGISTRCKCPLRIVHTICVDEVIAVSAFGDGLSHESRGCRRSGSLGPREKNQCRSKSHLNDCSPSRARDNGSGNCNSASAVEGRVKRVLITCARKSD